MRKLDASPIPPFAGFETLRGFSHQHPEETTPWTWKPLFASQNVERLTQGPSRPEIVFLSHSPPLPPVVKQVGIPIQKVTICVSPVAAILYKIKRFYRILLGFHFFCLSRKKSWVPLKQGMIIK